MMKIEIESTDEIIEFDGVPCRVWHGETAAGVPCNVYVHRVAVHRRHDTEQFERELQEMSPPRAPVPGLIGGDA